MRAGLFATLMESVRQADRVFRAAKPKQTKGVYRWTGSGWLVVGLSKNGGKDYLDPARVIWDLLL